MTERFDDVVRNAFDFLSRSLDELKAHPKYSVIHFYSAIELFLKARLLKEHWALIVAKPEHADRAAFQRGDFMSVGLKEANDRLSKIAGDGLLDEELKCFDGLRKERNQMVHFAHMAQGAGADAETELERIISDHARGWLYLRRLLARRWNVHFADYSQTVSDMDARMREQTNSLERKFLLLTDDIATAAASGEHFMHCPSCGFKSFACEEPVAVVLGKCLTCAFSSFALSLKCEVEACAKTILLTGGHERCPDCNHTYKPEDVEEVLRENDLLTDVSALDVTDVTHVSCGMCGGVETVVQMGTGEWFCTDCFDLEGTFGQCEWCSGLTTHLREDSYLFGCGNCEGRIDHDRDD